MKAIAQYIIAACVLILSAFVAFYLFLAMAVVAVCVFAYVYVRRWLARTGVMQKTDDTPDPQVTIIEGQFETVEVKPESLPEREQP